MWEESLLLCTQLNPLWVKAPGTFTAPSSKEPGVGAASNPPWHPPAMHFSMPRGE